MDVHSAAQHEHEHQHGHSHELEHEHEHDELGTGAIIDVLTNLHPDLHPDAENDSDPEHDHQADEVDHEAGPSDEPLSRRHYVGQAGEAGEGDVRDELDLEGWTAAALRAEVVRLRRLARRGVDRGVAEPHGEHGDSAGPATDHTLLEEDDGGEDVASENATTRKRKRTRKHSAGAPGEKGTRVKVLRSDGSGKRVEKTRRPELSKAVRTRMREVLGVGAADPLPHPSTDAIEGYYVPNWRNPSDEQHTTWIEGIARDVIMAPAPKIPPEDLDWDTVMATAHTSFTNLCKKYAAENHPHLAERRERYTKSRRRWARKDLKQKRRTRASLDPAFLPSRPLPPTALGMDYVSSEYSSAGEDSEDADDAVKNIRRAKWAEALEARQAEQQEREERGKAGWAEGLSEKVLEVRRARWRSDELNAIYVQLDEIASIAAAQRSLPASLAQPSDTMTHLATRLGHVAPSHSRFVMPPPAMRRGRIPRGDAGEGWMWATGEAGVWPARGDVAAAATDVSGAAAGHSGEAAADLASADVVASLAGDTGGGGRDGHGDADGHGHVGGDHEQEDGKYGHVDADGHPEIVWDGGINLVDALVGLGAEAEAGDG